MSTTPGDDDDDDGLCISSKIEAESSPDPEAKLASLCSGGAGRRLKGTAPHYWAPAPKECDRRDWLRANTVSLDTPINDLKIHIHRHDEVRYVDDMGGPPGPGWTRRRCGDNNKKYSRSNRPILDVYSYDNLELFVGWCDREPMMHFGGADNKLTATVLIDGAYEYKTDDNLSRKEKACEYDVPWPGITVIDMVPGCGLWLKMEDVSVRMEGEYLCLKMPIN